MIVTISQKDKFNSLMTEFGPFISRKMYEAKTTKELEVEVRWWMTKEAFIRRNIM